MTPLTRWKISKEGLGSARIYADGWSYAGGVAVVSFDGGPTGQGDDFDIYLVADRTLVIACTLDGTPTPTTFAWSPYDTTQMVLKDDNHWSNIDDPATADSDKRYWVENAGGGDIRLQSVSDSRWISGSEGGWFVHEWSRGSASITHIGDADTVQVSGDHWFIFLATGSAHDLQLSKRAFGARSLAGVDLSAADLTGADLSQIESLQGADFTGATLDGARLPHLSLGQAARCNGASLVGTDLTALLDARGAKLAGAHLGQAVARGVDFSGADLNGADLRSADLRGADFTGADLRGALFADAHLSGARFDGARMSGTHFDHADLTGTVFDAKPDFARSGDARTTFIGATVPFASIGADWTYLDLTDATLTALPTSITALVADDALLPDGLDLSGRTLENASFVGTCMTNVVLSRSDLTGAVMRQARLEGARLDGADLTRADLTGAWLIAAQSGEQGVARASAATASGATMIDTLLDGAHCDGVDFSGCRFFTSTFVSAGQPARARGAFLNFAKFDNGFLVAADFEAAELSGSSFANATLVDASFRGATLSPTGDSTHTPTTLIGADLRGADFSGSNMDAVDMRGATISTGPGTFSTQVEVFGGRKLPLDVDYTASVKGNTTVRTLLPVGW